MNPSATASTANVPTLRWNGKPENGRLVLIDQTHLPSELRMLECRDVETVGEAICSLRVRGAPAIGIAAAYGLCLGLQPVAFADETIFHERLLQVADFLAGTRPTAVNLFWALNRMKQKGAELRGVHSPIETLTGLLAEAKAIEEEDRQMCWDIGQHGQVLLEDDTGVLTHCNAGGLATAAFGTALSVLYAAHQAGKRLHVYADETRPLLQGARLTSWELQQWGIPVTVICDSAAAQVMRQQRVSAVITGADRIAANGDSANKIGTYSLACLAAAHKIPFYIAAPSSTFDLSLPTGQEIPIEQRSSEEVSRAFGRQTVPHGVDVYNPAFDVTPAELIHALICEKGIIQPVTKERIAEVISEET